MKEARDNKNNNTQQSGSGKRSSSLPGQANLKTKQPQGKKGLKKKKRGKAKQPEDKAEEDMVLEYDE